MSIERAAAGNILIVDDMPENLDLLAKILKERGYKARRVLNGRAALKAAEAEPPDLILLDINLPDLDGYTVCSQLKALPALADVPVIFVSALTETLDKVRAFRSGGVDYVTKPIQVEEVEARIGAQLRLRRLQRELESKNTALAEHLASLRALEELRDNLVHMVVHDIRSPLSGVMTLLQLAADPGEPLRPETREHLRRALRATEEIAGLAVSMLEVSRMEAGKLPLVQRREDLAALARRAIDSVTPLALARSIQLRHDGNPTAADVDADVLHRVLVNLLNNAIKFTPAGGQVQVRVAETPAGARVEVLDQGPGVPPELRDRVFQKFGDERLRRAGLKQAIGLGLTFCRLAVQAHGGEIGVDATDTGGGRFWFCLPRP